MQASNSRLEKLNQQYNTGAKFTQASENPTGMGTKMRLDAEIATYTQYSVNAGLASDHLNLEETSLSSIYDQLSSVVTTLQASVNGTYDQANLETVAASLEESRDMIYDLMNTRTASGEYIFSGNQSLTPTFSKTSDGEYVCNADGGSRQIKVSPSVVITSSDSGLDVFQRSQICRTATADANATLKYSDSIEFDSFVNGYYDKTSDNNTLSVEYDGTNYAIKDRDGATLQEGTVKEGDAITFKGVDITPKNGKSTITLEPPENDNILNTLSNIIDALRDKDLSNEEKTKFLQQGQVATNNAKENINMTLGHVGSRLSNIDKVISSNETLNEIKTTTRANQCEVDVYEVVSGLLQEQNALNVAQQTFSKVNGSTLFDFIN